MPEGIIFQSSNAYAQLRKFLIEKGLFAIVSLPVGVFNPYAKTTKTSILFVDKEIQARIGGVIFVKVENDGFDLGAERFPIPDNDLPNALNILRSVRNKTKTGDMNESVYFEVVSVSDLVRRPEVNLAILHDIQESEHKLLDPSAQLPCLLI